MPAFNQSNANRQLAVLLSALNSKHWPAWTLGSGPTLVDGRSVVHLKFDQLLRGGIAPSQVIEVRLSDGELTEAMVEALHAAAIPAWAY
ncbi:MAG: hypothetical protein QM765_28635 [Myxococcales bacterium]